MPLGSIGETYGFTARGSTPRLWHRGLLLQPFERRTRVQRQHGRPPDDRGDLPPPVPLNANTEADTTSTPATGARSIRI
jgi:hypothetical protein